MAITYDNTDKLSVKERILRNVASTLEGISTAEGYANTIKGVYRFRIAPWDVPSPAFCIVGVKEDKQAIEGNPPRMNVILFVTITAVATASPEDDSETLHNSLLLDAEAALQVDVTRGGLARETVTDGTDLEIALAARPYGASSLTIKILFQCGRADPTKSY